jgi:Notch-like protein
MMSFALSYEPLLQQANASVWLLQVGHQLRTTLRVKKDEQGNDMIYPWKPSAPGGQGSYMGPSSSSGVIAYLELDNRKCTITEGSVCFPTANEVSWQWLKYNLSCSVWTYMR